MVTTCYHPVINGVVRMVNLYQKHLTALGHRVTVFTFGRPHPQDGDQTVRIPALPLGKTGYYIRPRFPKNIISQLNQMDIVHCHHLFMGPELLAGEIKLPVVYTNHTRYDLYTEAYFPLPIPHLRKKAAQRAIQWLWPLNTAQCAAVIAPSKNIADVMKSFRVTAPIHIIRNGVELESFSANQKGSNTLTGICVGRLAAEKNISLLLDSLIQICQQNKNIRFQLIGHGPLHAACKQKITQNNLHSQIILEGWVPKEEVPSFLEQADFQISMSVSEVHPLGIIEGMASGLPAVVLAGPAMIECVGDGALVAKTPAEWVEAVQALSSSADLQHALGEKALRQAQKYSIKQTIEQTLKLYHQLIKQAQV